MPAALPIGFELGAIAPRDAFAAFVARGLLRGSFRWQDVWAEEHTRAFAVAGVLRLDVLRLIHDQVEASIARGRTLADFSAELKRQLVAKGFWGDVGVTDPATGEVRTTRFDDRRLKLIFDVNLRQSHAAGRWARGMRSGMTHVVYRTMGDERVRASHRPWDWVCLPKDHPWWDTHIPPNGWGCRCHFFFVNQAGIERLQKAGRKLRFEPPADDRFVDFRNTSTGQVERVPWGIDPGFAYNPGKAHVQRGVDRLGAGLARLDQLRQGMGQAAPAATAAGDGHALRRAVIHRQRSEPGFAAFLRDPPAVRRGEPPIGLPVAAVPPAAGAGGAPLPTVASVGAAELAAQRASELYPLALPESAAAWAMAQVLVDQGQRLALDNAERLVLWWWQRGDRVETLLLERSALVWWVKAQQRLTVEEAAQKYPRLAPLLVKDVEP